MSYSDDQLRGVGGWLALLVISLLVLGPLRDLIGTFSELNSVQEATPRLVDMPIWGTMKATIWVFSLVQIAMMIFTG
jgi:hypothetical protein